MSDDPRQDESPQAEPLPIWFFVGAILVVYGLIIMGSDLVGNTRVTVLAELHPGLWWGAIIAVAGAVFTAIGWIGHRRGR